MRVFGGKTAIRVTEGDPKQFRDVVNIDVVGACLAAHYLVPLMLSSEAGAKSFRRNLRGACMGHERAPWLTQLIVLASWLKRDW